MSEKVDMLDLIITTLKDHEKKLDEISQRLETIDYILSRKDVVEALEEHFGSPAEGFLDDDLLKSFEEYLSLDVGTWLSESIKAFVDSREYLLYCARKRRKAQNKADSNQP